MKKKLQRLIDSLNIWAVRHFRLDLPDLVREQSPKPGQLYYYYGRWLRLVRHDDATQKWLANYGRDHNLLLTAIPDNLLSGVDEINEKNQIFCDLAANICTHCALRILDLPCRKSRRSYPNDQCLNHHYELIKGKNHDEEIQSQLAIASAKHQ